MAYIHIDGLLETVVKRGASDLHLAVGRPPVLRLHGSLRSLETKVLEPEDTVALMKAITPEKNQQELQEEGGTDFGFAFGADARFRVSVFMPPPGDLSRHRADRVGQDHHVGHHDRLRQRAPGPAHHHGRGSD